MKILIIILFTLQPFLSNEASALFELKGTGSRFSACSFIKMLFFCWDMLYRLWKQYDHVILSYRTNLRTPPGSHLINLCANSCKLINHGIKPSGQQ